GIINDQNDRTHGGGDKTRDVGRQKSPRRQHHQTIRPPAKVRPAPTEQKMIRSPDLKMPSSAAQPSAIETEAPEVLPYLEIVTTNFSKGMPTRLPTALRMRSLAWWGTIHEMSSGVSPWRRMASSISLAKAITALLKTAPPSIC